MLRRSLAMAAGEQYFRLAVGFISIVLVSRLLTPGEIGVAVIGMGIAALALGLREFATSDFLIRRQEVTRDDVRTSFTVVMLLTVLIVLAMFVLAPWFGTFYGEEKLSPFLRIAAAAGLIESLSLPIRGLLRRDMEFGALAFVNTASATVTAVVTVALAFAGFSYMGFAWAAVAAAGTTTILSFYFRPDSSILRPALGSWRSVLTFGGYNGASHVINQVCDELPQLVLGRVLPHAAVGVYDRANVTAGIPNRIILTSVSSVAFPALAAEIRKGGTLKEPYLRALGYITVFYWPALVLLALLAYPVVSVLLGRQWLGVVAPLQVMAIAGLAWFPVMLTAPVLLALGANRDRALSVLLGRTVSAAVLCSAAYFGVMAMAASKLVTQPYHTIVSFWFVRRHIPFRWSELWGALWPSLVVTTSTAAGPGCAVALSGSGFDLSIGSALVALVLAAAGWLIGVLITRHPVWLEVKNAAEVVAAMPFAQRWRLRGRLVPRAGNTG